VPIVHHVKKSAKAYRKEGIKKGEAYYWWKSRRTVGNRYVSTKHRSKTRPKPSQLTQSPFLKEVYALRESVESFKTWQGESGDELAWPRDNWVATAGGIVCDERDKLDNQPKSIQGGEQGRLFEERIEKLQQFIDALDAIDCDGDGQDVVADFQRAAEILSEL